MDGCDVNGGYCTGKIFHDKKVLRMKINTIINQLWKIPPKYHIMQTLQKYGQNHCITCREGIENNSP